MPGGPACTCVKNCLFCSISSSIEEMSLKVLVSLRTVLAKREDIFCCLFSYNILVSVVYMKFVYYYKFCVV